MIARIWHGITPIDKSDAYLEFLKQRAIPDYESVPGNCGVHFLTLTFWDSLDAIRQFAGEDISKAKYYPEDSDFLLEFEPTVKHYEVHG